MCGHKVKLPGLYYKKNITANIESKISVIKRHEKHKQFNFFLNNLWVALNRSF